MAVVQARSPYCRMKGRRIALPRSPSFSFAWITDKSAGRIDVNVHDANAAWVCIAPFSGAFQVTAFHLSNTTDEERSVFLLCVLAIKEAKKK